MVTLGKTDDGREFPILAGELLPWNIGMYMTRGEQPRGYPKAKTVIAAMQEHRPRQRADERYDMLRASSDRMFGHNARQCLALIDGSL